MAKKRNAELRPLRDIKRRKSPHDGLKYLDALLKPQDSEEEEANKPKRKGRRDGAKRLTATDA